MTAFLIGAVVGGAAVAVIGFSVFVWWITKIDWPF